MKYAVITYIFGKNQELLREPLIIDKGVEYICITDQKDLKSKIWKIIYEPQSNVKSLRDKVALVKFNPFKYTNADKIIIQDSSLQCISSLIPLFESINEYDIGLKKHPFQSNLKEELPYWKPRGLQQFQIKKFEKMASMNNIKLEEIPLYECCLLCIHNNEKTKEIFKQLLNLMKILGYNNDMIITQQCPFAYLLKTYYNNLKIKILNQHNYFNRYMHNTKRRNNS